MPAVRAPTTRLDALHARRAAAVRALVEPEVAAALAALREAGATVEIVGSFAQGRFRAASDVDFLILDAGPLSEIELDDLLSRFMRSAPFDLILADRLSPGTKELMLAHARAYGP